MVLAEETAALKARLRDRRAAFEAELQQLRRDLEGQALQVQQAFEQRRQAFHRQWAERLAKFPDPADPFWERSAGRTRESVVAEQARMEQNRARDLEMAEGWHDSSCQACGQRWQQERAQLLQELERMQAQGRHVLRRYLALLMA